MNSKNLTRASLFLLLLPPRALAADKISKETIGHEGKKRTYYLFAPASLKAPAPLTRRSRIKVSSPAK